MTGASPPGPNPLAAAYLDLVKGCLTRSLFPDARWDADLVRVLPFDAALREDGRDWPTEAETMVGHRRLDSLQACVETVVRERVPGDLLEAGVWRGGASILMRAVLRAVGETERVVWVADSFQGLPPPNPDLFPDDGGDRHWMLAPYLAVPLDAVRRNFARYGLLDDQVRFLPGWFQDTLPTAPIQTLAVLRLDGDMYESTMLTLTSLYGKLSPGGYVIVDDYGALANCRKAIDDFRADHAVTAPLVEVDWTGVLWRKP